MVSTEMPDDFSMTTNRTNTVFQVFTLNRIMMTLLAIVVTYSGQLYSQVDSFEVEFNKQYEKNIKKERLFGVYIPKDMSDAFIELERLSDKGSIEKFMNADEDEVASKLHFGLGNWMIVNWRFYEGSRFSHYLKQLGISHPDDMAQFTIVSWHRHLNERDLEIKKRAERYRVFRKKVAGVRDSLKTDSLKPPDH